MQQRKENKNVMEMFLKTLPPKKVQRRPCVKYIMTMRKNYNTD